MNPRAIDRIPDLVKTGRINEDEASEILAALAFRESQPESRTSKPTAFALAKADFLLGKMTVKALERSCLMMVVTSSLKIAFFYTLMRSIFKGLDHRELPDFLGGLQDFGLIFMGSAIFFSIRTIGAVQNMTTLKQDFDRMGE